MDIRVGAATKANNDGANGSRTRSGVVEAKILGIRAPRRAAGSAQDPAAERRHGDGRRDPINGRVMILMVPDGSLLPEGLESGAYRIFLRFARR